MTSDAVGIGNVGPCPECAVGKCGNCDGRTLDRVTDEIVACPGPPSSEPAIWLMDVDGVLNVLGPQTTSWTKWRRASADGFTMNWSPQLIDRIQALIDAGKVEVWWLTTWWDHIDALPFVDWHEFTVANTDAEYLDFDVDWWKLPVAQRVAAAGRKVIWTDDDLFDARAQEWLAAQPHVLGITPESWCGLTPEHLARVERFLSVGSRS